MDGNGNIQVNHWRYKNIQYRLVIKLKYSYENICLCHLLTEFIGGKLNIIGNNKFVL